MLTRPGSEPGPAWMRDLSDRMADPERYLSAMKWFWVFFAIFMLAGFALNQFLIAGSFQGHPYESPARIAGLPLVSYGPVARGVIAIGGRATGVVAFGGLAVGGFAFGGLAFGGIAVGGVSLGWLAIAGLAFGWRAVGGGAFGHGALGGLAVGSYAYAGGGVAYGYYEASGKQKESLFG